MKRCMAAYEIKRVQVVATLELKNQNDDVLKDLKRYATVMWAIEVDEVNLTVIYQLLSASTISDCKTGFSTGISRLSTNTA